MEEVDVNSRSFWEGAETVVFGPPDFREVSAALKERLAGEAELAAHVVFRTSGSADEAKYVCLSKRALLVSAAAVNRHLRVTREDRWLRALPLYHVGGFGIHARAFLEDNPVIVFDGKWDAARFAARCREEHITLTSLVPTQVYDLVNLGERAPDALRAIVVGGGTLTEVLGNEARELGWPVLQSYGLTEAGSQVATAELASLGPGKFRNRSLPLLDCWKARLNENGVLELCGGARFSAYLSPDRPMTSPWFATGDRVVLEERAGEPYVTFEAREGDVVKILGELVSLPELRERLERIAEEACVAGKVALVAVPDARRGVRLVLAAASGTGGDGIAAVMREFNAAVRGFERIEEVREVPEIPRSGIGKIACSRLAALVDGVKGGKK